MELFCFYFKTYDPVPPDFIVLWAMPFLILVLKDLMRIPYLG